MSEKVTRWHGSNGLDHPDRLDVSSQGTEELPLVVWEVPRQAENLSSVSDVFEPNGNLRSEGHLHVYQRLEGVADKHDTVWLLLLH
ncbi:hypothetical protein ES703_84040 [subsurface metagenome]